MSKYSDLIKEARKTERFINRSDSGISTSSNKKEKQNSVILENKKQNDSEQEREEKLAGISIKVPESLRRHWVVEAKRTGKSVTSVIINALTKEFGEP